MTRGIESTTIDNRDGVKEVEIPDAVNVADKGILDKLGDKLMLGIMAIEDAVNMIRFRVNQGLATRVSGKKAVGDDIVFDKLKDERNHRRLIKGGWKAKLEKFPGYVTKVTYTKEGEDSKVVEIGLHHSGEYGGVNER